VVTTDFSNFQAREATTTNERSPGDEVVRDTVREPEVANLRPALTVAAANGVMKWAKQQQQHLPLLLLLHVGD